MSKCNSILEDNPMPPENSGSEERHIKSRTEGRGHGSRPSDRLKGTFLCFFIPVLISLNHRSVISNNNCALEEFAGKDGGNRNIEEGVL